MTEELTTPSTGTTAPSPMHPPFKSSFHMEFPFPSFLTVLLPWILLDYVHLLSVLASGREFWISLSGRKQTMLKVPIALAWFTLVHLLVNFPTTSYYYTSSPGFRWIAPTPSLSSPTTSSFSEDQSPSLGRWEWSWSGQPSDRHPQGGDKPRSFTPSCWPYLLIDLPFVFCFVAFVFGLLGELGDDSYWTFFSWSSGVVVVCSPMIYYLARDGGALDTQGKRD